MTPDHIKEAAKVLLDWHDSLDDPFAQAIPIARVLADTPVAPVPLPAALPLLLVAVIILWGRS